LDNLILYLSSVVFGSAGAWGDVGSILLGFVFAGMVVWRSRSLEESDVFT